MFTAQILRQFRRGFRDAFDDVTGCVTHMASDKTNLVWAKGKKCIAGKVYPLLQLRIEKQTK